MRGAGLSPCGLSPCRVGAARTSPLVSSRALPILMPLLALLSPARPENPVPRIAENRTGTASFSRPRYAGGDPADASLGSLSLVSAGDDKYPLKLKPRFQSETYEYSLAQDPNHDAPQAVIITPVPNGTDVTIEVNGENVSSGDSSSPISLSANAFAIVVVTADATQHAYTVHLRQSLKPPPPPSPEAAIVSWFDKASTHPGFVSLMACLGGFVAVCCVGVAIKKIRRPATVDSVFEWRKSRGSDHASFQVGGWKAQPFYSPSVGPYMGGGPDDGPARAASPPALDITIGAGPNPFSEAHWEKDTQSYLEPRQDANVCPSLPS